MQFSLVTFKPLPERRILDLSADIFQKAGEPREALPDIGEGGRGGQSLIGKTFRFCANFRCQSLALGSIAFGRQPYFTRVFALLITQYLLASFPGRDGGLRWVRARRLFPSTYLRRGNNSRVR